MGADTVVSEVRTLVDTEVTVEVCTEMVAGLGVIQAASKIQAVGKIGSRSMMSTMKAMGQALRLHAENPTIHQHRQVRAERPSRQRSQKRRNQKWISSHSETTKWPALLR